MRTAWSVISIAERLSQVEWGEATGVAVRAIASNYGQSEERSRPVPNNGTRAPCSWGWALKCVQLRAVQSGYLFAPQLATRFSFNYEKYYFIRCFGSRVIVLKLTTILPCDLLVVEVALRSYFPNYYLDLTHFPWDWMALECVSFKSKSPRTEL